MHATDGTSRLSLREAAHCWPVVQALLASIVVVLPLGCFLVFRRATGAFSSPLASAPLIATAAMLCAWAVAIRAMMSESLGRRWATVLPLCVLLTFAAACSYPGLRLIDWLVWPTAIIVFAIAGHRIDSKIAGRPRRPVRPATGERGSLAIEIENEPTDEQLLQQITRSRDAEGRETIHAQLVAEFLPGARQATLFAAFCPPFERLPHVEASVTDDSDSTVKLVQVLHNGVQLEVRLPEPADEPSMISIELYAAEAEQ